MRKIMLVSLLCLVTFIVAGLCISALVRKIADRNIIDVSMEQLFANPSEYNGKKIRVGGVGNIGFESNSIYKSVKDWEAAESHPFDISEAGSDSYYNVLGIRLKTGSYTNAADFNGKHVIIEGRFDMHSHGHMGRARYGSIVDATRYDLLNPE